MGLADRALGIATEGTALGYFYVLLGLGALVLLAFLLSLRKRFARPYRLPYVADAYLFTPAQRAFLAVLERAVGPDYRVFGRVRAVDVIGLRRRPRLDRANRRRASARLWDQPFDFLVCTARTGAICCAVNLAPRSRLRREPFHDALDRICAAAGLPFLRVVEAEVYSVTEIAARVTAAIGSRRPPAEPVDQPPAAMSEGVPTEVQDALHELSAVIVADDRGPRRPPLQARPMPDAAVPAASGAAIRVEPPLVQHDDAELDLGPAFHIDDVHLDDDDGPVRLRRS